MKHDTTDVDKLIPFNGVPRYSGGTRALFPAMHEVVGRNGMLKIYEESVWKGISRNAEDKDGHGIFIEITYGLEYNI